MLKLSRFSIGLWMKGLKENFTESVALNVR